MFENLGDNLRRDVLAQTEVIVPSFIVVSIFPSWFRVAFEEIYRFHFAHFVLDLEFCVFACLRVREEVVRVLDVRLCPDVGDIGPALQLVQPNEVLSIVRL